MIPAALAVLGVVSACSASSGASNDFGGGGSGAGNGTGGSSASGGTSTGGSPASGGGGGISLDGGGNGGGAGLGDGSACTSELHEGKLSPLDMYVMLDISGSMNDTTGGTGSPTKWAAIKQAFTNFLGSSQSAGLGVGIQYFPLLKAGVPKTCTTSTQCTNSSGPCGFPSSCSSALSAGNIQPCGSNAQCTGGRNDRCVQLGVCAQLSGYVCYPIGSTTACGNGGGNCIAQGSCVNEDSCTVADYSNPAVPIGTLPGVASAITSSLAAQSPFGATPTGPALQGAITYAESWAKKNPSHKVIAVLATDGLPTECPVAPATVPDINQIAGYATQGVQNGIDTFVIGVFGPNDTQSQTNLNTIAKQGVPGGTGQAIIVDTSQNVTQQFIDALNKIRGSALSCEFQIPQPQDGGTLDFNKVNVLFTDASGNKVPVYYVTDKSQCDPTKGGWYYDVDPSKGTPTKIIVCSATCNTFQTTVNATVNIALGCQTKIKPPA